MKILVISDTHNKHRFFRDLPKADMIIHCGDFSHDEKQMNDFLLWYGDLDYKYKLLIAGNHDGAVAEKTIEDMRMLKHTLGIDYLQDESIVIEGIKFHGSPWSVNFGNWWFMKDDFELQTYWDKIDDDVEVLITHGPAKNVGDLFQHDIMEPNVGSSTLSYTINKRLKKLKYHFFGHIHEDFGIHQTDFNKNYIAYNASSYNYWNMKINKPWVFEINNQ